jgi:hypothetical protein
MENIIRENDRNCNYYKQRIPVISREVKNIGKKTCYFQEKLYNERDNLIMGEEVILL